jgi:hypothetical protein
LPALTAPGPVNGQIGIWYHLGDQAVDWGLCMADAGARDLYTAARRSGIDRLDVTQAR